MSQARMRELKCITCGNTWQEPVRPGARPWECPKCNPAAAARRDRERERAQRKARPASTVEVPPIAEDLVRDIVNHLGDYPAPGREELATAVRKVAGAQGHTALRDCLADLATVSLAWAAWLPATKALPRDAENAA